MKTKASRRRCESGVGCRRKITPELTAERNPKGILSKLVRFSTVNRNSYVGMQ